MVCGGVQGGRGSSWLWGLVFLATWPARLAYAEASGEAVRSEPRPAASPTQVTAADLETRRKQAEQHPELSDELKGKIAELYRLAGEQLQRAEQFKTQAAEDKTAAETAQERAAKLRQELAQASVGPPEPPPHGSLTELEQRLSTKGLQLQELKNAQARKEAAPAAQASRRKDLRNRLLAVPQQSADVKQQLEAPPPADEPAPLTLARQTELLTRSTLLEQEPAALQSELAKYDAQDAADLIRIERDILAQQIATAQREFDALNGAVRRKRDEEAQAAVQRAQEEAIEAQPLLKANAEENTRLAEEARALTQLIADADKELQKVKLRLENLQRQFDQTKKKVESVGLTGPIGLMLRKQRAELPNVRKRLQNLQKRRPLINDAQFALFEYDDIRSDLSDLDPHLRRISNPDGRRLNADEQSRLTEAATTVLERQRDYLDSLIRSYSAYFDVLVELDSTERQLIKLAGEYQNYVDERVLWIRTAKPLHAAFQLDPFDLHLLNPSQWYNLGLKLWEDLRSNWHLYGALLVILVSLLRVGGRFRRDLGELGEVAARGSCCEFLPTLRAGVLTVMIALPWPLLLLALGWRLGLIPNSDEFVRGAAHGLTATGWVYLLLELTRQVCRPEGLAEAHFSWPTAVTRNLRQDLRAVMLFGLPLVMFTSALHAVDPQHGQDVLERIGCLLGAIVLAFFLRRMLCPQNGILREHFRYHPGGWADRLKHVLCWSAVAAPLLLGGLSLFGYHYTARQLAFRLFVTLAFALSLLVLHATLLRLVLIMRRRLLIAEARRRRAERAETQSQSTAPGSLSPQQLLGPVAERADFSTQSLQTRRLAGIGMLAITLLGFWLIWADVVPALGILDRWPLWTTTMTVTAAVGDGGISLPTQAHEQIVHITLADLGLAGLISIITFVAARNIPGLMEISLLQRLPLEHSVRYAITSLASYLIVLVGAVAGCHVIGLRWSQIQWLATALTFGLAFGLQEMFANFVAGLILLFERPIRVGDVVTVDDTTGVVSRIRIRATTIKNWDHKEFVVPNKDFITGKVLNWTLTDEVNRVVVNVGIAYGADTELAHELLLQVAQNNPLIRKDPPPIASFEGFGDSCLNFSLRAFLSTMESRLPAINSLHMEINKAFQQAGIEIAFPQRDLHLRTLPAGISLGQPAFVDDRKPRQVGGLKPAARAS